MRREPRRAVNLPHELMPMPRSSYSTRFGTRSAASDAFGCCEAARGLSLSRRDFLRSAAGVALGSALMGASPFVRGETARKKRKVIVITFGGGARDQETFAPEGQENIPNMLHELAPPIELLHPRHEPGNPGPLRRDREPGHRRVRNPQ